METKEKTIILKKIKEIKDRVLEIVQTIEIERKDNIGEDAIILQQLEDQKDMLVEQIMNLKESLILAERFGFKEEKFTLDFNGRSREISIVLPALANPVKGQISFDSPLAKALSNKKKGDVVEVSTPMGVHEYRVIESG